MKCNELTRLLTQGNCRIVRHGKRHDIWQSQVTEKKMAVPRHGSQEIPVGTAQNIIKTLLG
ncbi:MAG: type II toxin-antitoxin system HicA family toxin [Prevotellaceae bacterium]|nr:type II toxin-antitoxin system HicA family toxin [Prevotellaceae bacterium]